MNIIAVDDERLALSNLQRILSEVEVFNGAEIKGFNDPFDAVAYCKEKKVEGKVIDFAFLDVEMYDLSGIELAKMIKDIYPKVKILFVTGYDNYAYEAFKIHAKGYVLKPATKELIEEEVINIMDLKKEESKQKVVIKTFGNFDIYVDGKPVIFERNKAKELLAFLVDRQGNGVKTADISAVLWEDKEYNRSVRNQTQTIISSMIKNLKEAGAESIIIKKWNYLALDISEIDCDYYKFLKGDTEAINSYLGEYMCQYSWAEFTTATLSEKLNVIYKL